MSLCGMGRLMFLCIMLSHNDIKSSLMTGATYETNLVGWFERRFERDGRWGNKSRVLTGYRAIHEQPLARAFL